MASSPTQTNLGVQSNVGGLLCYAPCCIGFIFSVVAAIVEKQSRFLRFHAFQSLLLHAAAFAIGIAFQFFNIVLAMLHVGLLSLLMLPLGLLFGLAVLVVQIYLMVKAYGNEETSLPVIGPMAQKWA